MKDWRLCIGDGCAIEDNFEGFNCAVHIDDATPEDEFSLGPGEPGCDLGTYCSDGMYEPCDIGEETWEGSATVDITWPTLDPSDVIA